MDERLNRLDILMRIGERLAELKGKLEERGYYTKAEKNELGIIKAIKNELND